MQILCCILQTLSTISYHQFDDYQHTNIQNVVLLLWFCDTFTLASVQRNDLIGRATSRICATESALSPPRSVIVITLTPTSTRLSQPGVDLRDLNTSWRRMRSAHDSRRPARIQRDVSRKQRGKHANAYYTPYALPAYVARYAAYPGAGDTAAENQLTSNMSSPNSLLHGREH
jgi:hypothetical protein